MRVHRSTTAILGLRFVAAFVAAVVSSFCLAADPASLVIPKITRPLVEPAENDPLQADYDKMWTEYESEVQKATVAIKEALDKQIAKATESGELDLVEMWEGKQKQFAEKGLLDWDTGSKASVEWKKKNPKVPYPREFNEAVRNSTSIFASAKEKLDEGYADLVKAYTKAKNIPRAKELRDEGVGLTAGVATASDKAPVEISTPKKETPFGLAGKVAYDPASRVLTVNYDFETPDQLADFVVWPDPSAASIRRGQLLLAPKAIATHKVAFKTVSISGALTLPPAQSEKKPVIRLGVSMDRKVFAYGSGSIRTDATWADVGGVRYGAPTRFEFKVGSPEMSLTIERKSKAIPCNLAIVGGPVLEGSDQGCAFDDLVVSGKVIDE